jgi:hypothetical protein
VQPGRDFPAQFLDTAALQSLRGRMAEFENLQSAQQVRTAKSEGIQPRAI